MISTSPSSVYPGTTYTITGTQLNGLTQGAYYGDDVQAATNYPIVQITNSATGHVFYGRTFNISTESVAPGAAVSTNFTVPANIETGASSLVVIANGIPSAAVPIGVRVYPLTTAASPTNGGTVTPASGTYYAPNTVVNLTATANAGYTFSSWTGNVANANSASTTVTMSGPQSVTANFVAIAPQVTASPSSISFGNVELCRTKTALVTLHDSASTLVQIGPISLIDVTGNPSDFTIRSYSTTGILGPGKGRSYQIQVKFSPSAELAESATLNIVTNAPGSPVLVPITGTGIKGPKSCDLNP